MELARRVTILAAMLLVATGDAWGVPYSQLIVFGDSLSDVGNVHGIPLLPYPGAGYWQGRFSNGPVYSEHLALGLGLGPLTPSRNGGTNYAYGGAQIAELEGIQALFINDVDEQLDAYLSDHTPDPAALYVLFAGANNFFNGAKDTEVPLGQMQQQLSRLVEAGAQQLLVPNLPLLGETPEYNGNPALRSEFNALTTSYNAGLAGLLDTLEVSFPQIDVFRLDVAGMVSSAIADPENFGLTNVTDQAAAGLEPGRFFYSSSNVVDNPDGYLFWDHVHPTAAGHQLLGELALDLVALPGDFNGDGVVNALDYVVWRNNLGQAAAHRLPGDANGDTRVDHRDYRLWKENFGATRSPMASSLHSIPEPLTGRVCLVLMFVAVRALAGKQWRFRTLPKRQSTDRRESNLVS